MPAISDQELPRAQAQAFQLVESVSWLEVLDFKYWCIICLCNLNYFRVGPTGLVSSRILTIQAKLFRRFACLQVFEGKKTTECFVI